MKIVECRAFHLRAPLEQPYKTTFGALTGRQAVFVLLTAEDGSTGVGETYINFPPWATFERLASYREAFFPAIAGREIADIPSCMSELWRRFYRAALQGGALGPTLQGLTALSTALWDLRAKIEGVPLRGLFSETPADDVRVYGSGINPPFPKNALREALDRGVTTFKLKLGFGGDEDRRNVRELKTLLGGGIRLAVDVNRSWSFDEAVSWMPYLRDEDIAWLEEPLAPAYQHRYPELLELSAVPVSAGENFLIPPGSDFSIEGEWGLSLNDSRLALNIVQPAVVKNCCFSDAVRFARHAETLGMDVYPHFLGSAPGMAASAQLAALTKAAHLEWDVNPNPLRTSCFTEPFVADNGVLRLPDAPGIGWDIRDEVLERWSVDRVLVRNCD